MTAPRILARVAAQVRLDGVHDDVAHRPQELPLALLENGSEAAAEQVSVPSVSPVEAKRAPPVQPLDRCGEPKAGLREAQEPAMVIRHQREREAVDFVPA